MLIFFVKMVTSDWIDWTAQWKAYVTMVGKTLEESVNCLGVYYTSDCK